MTPPVRVERSEGRRPEDSAGAVLLALWSTKRLWIALAIGVGSAIGWVMNTAVVPRRQIDAVALRVDSSLIVTQLHIRQESSRDSAQDAQIERLSQMIESWAVGECLTKPRNITVRMDLPCTRLLNDR